MALEAIRRRSSIEQVADDWRTRETMSYETVVAERRLLPPLDHADSARWLVTGTGLSHLGSAAARDAMHAKLQTEETQLTDSMKMFKWGLEGGKPAAGEIGVQPEWFYKGDGRCVVAPEQPLELPAYALDGGDEVEVVGLYVIGDDGEVYRVGFALGNEYADHVMERQNYLYLAHSKLRQCAYGPELLLGELPASVSGTARLTARRQRDLERHWLSGNDNMAHSHRQPRAPPLQVSRLPPAGRCACPFLRRGYRQLHQERQSAGRRCVRDRVRSVRPATAQPVGTSAGAVRFCAGACAVTAITANGQTREAPAKKRHDQR